MSYVISEHERIVFTAIKQNSSISEKRLLEIIDLPDSNINMTLCSLVKKGLVLKREGRFSKSNPVICIGGANIDRKFYLKNDMAFGTSNPVNTSVSIGGVARNIAENLGRLGEEVILISARGNDHEWNVIEEGSSPFMNLKHVAKYEDASTGSYTAIINKNGHLSIALANMDIYEKITPELLLRNSELLKIAKCIIVDLNCPSETIDFLCSFSSQAAIPLVLIPVSSPKMERLPKSLGAVSWLIVNREETETFLNMVIHNRDDWEDAVKMWLALGVKNVIVTNGSKGVMAGDQDGKIHFTPAIQAPAVVDVTGAGDSFCSGVIFSWLQKENLDISIKSGLVNASKTIMSKSTVREELTIDTLLKELEEV